MYEANTFCTERGLGIYFFSSFPSLDNKEGERERERDGERATTLIISGKALGPLAAPHHTPHTHLVSEIACVCVERVSCPLSRKGKRSCKTPF